MKKQTINDNNLENLHQNIPITYLWFGKSAPQDYLISLAQTDYPVIFLKDPKIERQFNREIMNVEKSDYYRLYYLYQHGGIYSDFDNTINYSCLIDLLQPYKNSDKLIFMSDEVHNRQKTKQIMNNLIYAPKAKMPILKKILDAVDQNKQKVWQFAGLNFLQQFQDLVQIDMSKCVKHAKDWSWFSASNQILGRNSKPNQRFVKKNIKKFQIISKNLKLSKQIHKKNIIIKKMNRLYQLKNKQNRELRQKIQIIYLEITKKYPFATQIFEKQFKKSNQISLQSTNNQINNEKKSKNIKDFQGQRFILQNKIKQLQVLNKDIQFQKDIINIQNKIGICIIILILFIGFILFKKKTITNDFKKLRNQQIQEIQQKV